MSQVFKVVKQGEVQVVDSQKSENGKVAKCELVLQSLGGKYADTFACTLKGNDADSTFYPGELVDAELHFYAHEYGGHWFQDVLVDEIVKRK